MNQPTPTAFVIGNIAVKDPSLWAEYRSKLPATLLPWRGEVLARGRQVMALSGESRFTAAVVIRFPDAATVAGWYASPAYQALIPLRERAAEVVLVGYET